MTGSSSDSSEKAALQYCDHHDGWARVTLGKTAEGFVKEFYERHGLSEHDVVVIIRGTLLFDEVEILDLYDGWYAARRYQDNEDITDDVDGIMKMLPFCFMHSEPLIHFGVAVVFIEDEDGLRRIGDCMYYSECRELIERAVYEL